MSMIFATVERFRHDTDVTDFSILFVFDYELCLILRAQCTAASTAHAACCLVAADFGFGYRAMVGRVRNLPAHLMAGYLCYARTFATRAWPLYFDHAVTDCSSFHSQLPGDGVRPSHMGPSVNGQLLICWLSKTCTTHYILSQCMYDIIMVFPTAQLYSSIQRRNRLTLTLQ
jgi:hypothetical protein